VDRVLVVDDDPITREVLVSQLAADGLEVVEAEDGMIGLEMLRSMRPDVVLLDLEMPKLDGFGVLGRLTTGAPGDVPIIVLTGRDSSADATRALELGALDYLRKPVEAVELRARVRTALRLKKVQDELRRTNVELEDAVRTDMLTSLPNRRHVVEHLTRTAAAARRHRTRMSVLMVDIDHFKRVNDSEGHAGGDIVLRAVASRIKGVLRAEDMAGRWGGEEFLLVLPATDIEGAWHLGERVREVVSAEPIPVGADRDLVVTVSIGCAEGHGDDLDDHLRRADRALYEAKAAGRNHVARDTTFAA
jgi:two-component system cell cycle response regulator